MNRDNPFDRMFGFGNNEPHWTDEMVKEFIESFNTPNNEIVSQGRRVEDDNDVTVQVTAGSDEPVRATIDLSSKIGGKPKSVANATFKNGILDVEFEYESDE